MSRQAWLRAGTACTAWLLALLAPLPSLPQTQDQLDTSSRTLRARQRLWEPREATRAIDAAGEQARTAPTGPSGAPSAPLAVPGAPPLPEPGPESLPWGGIPAPGQPLASGLPPAPMTTAPGTPAPQRAGAPDRNAPVTFTAETINYDEPTQTVTATGRVEAWQNDRVLQADRVTFDRRTGIARAEGNVVLVEPDGQVLFAESAALNQDFSEGIVRSMRGLLADNGRMAATAARRRDGRLTEMFRTVYTTCDPCERDPQRAPLWQLRARRAQHDQEAKRIEYWDTTMEMAGIPIFYIPYFNHADPTVKRASGLLPPLVGTTTTLGNFFSVPYFQVIDPQTDITVEPIFTTEENAVLTGELRRRFDSGYLSFRGSGTYDSQDQWRGHILGAGRFTVNDTWRTGFDLARASDSSYLRNYRFGSPAYLTTRPFVEGFWGRSYALLDASAYQGLASIDADIPTPLVVPRALFAYNGPPGWMGGRARFDFGGYGITRQGGTDSARIGGRADWSSEVVDAIGSRWSFGTRMDLYGYNFGDFPSGVGTVRAGSSVIAHPQVFGMWRLPLYRRYGSVTHRVEPMLQAVAAPVVGRNNWPNEDSRDVEFTDANLFNLNRFPGRDQLEGGARMMAGLRNTLFLDGGQSMEVMFGQSYRANYDNQFDPQSGLADRISDYVARVSIDPLPWFGLSYRTRIAKDQLRQTFSDVSATFSRGPVSASASYVYVPPSATALRPVRREEVGGGVYVGPFDGTPLARWRGYAAAYYDLQQSVPVYTTFGAIYEDECFIFNVRFLRTYTNPALNAAGGSTLLFQLTFKTVGDFGFSPF
jgi:LPS-assembly protein